MGGEEKKVEETQSENLKKSSLTDYIPFFGRKNKENSEPATDDKNEESKDSVDKVT